MRNARKFGRPAVRAGSVGKRFAGRPFRGFGQGKLKSSLLALSGHFSPRLLNDADELGFVLSRDESRQVMFEED